MKKLLVGITTCHKADYFIDVDTRDWLDSVRTKDPLARRTAQRETFLTQLPMITEDGGIEVDHKFFFGNRLRQGEARRNIFAKAVAPEPLPEPLADEVYLDVIDSYLYNSNKLQNLCRYALDNGYTNLLKLDDDTFIYPQRVLQTGGLEYVYAGAGNGSFAPGSAMFLNEVGMNLVATSRIHHWADDLWVGDVMAYNGIRRNVIPSFNIEFGDKYLVNPYALPKDHTYSALHSCTPEGMRVLFSRGM